MFERSPTTFQRCLALTVRDTTFSCRRSGDEDPFVIPASWRRALAHACAIVGGVWGVSLLVLWLTTPTP